MHKLLLESALKARIYKFSYAKYQNDPNPSVLYLGRWNQPDTKSTLIGGININYLNRSEIQQLSQGLGDIMPGNSLKSRSRRLERAFPEIFDKAYRTYEISAISNLSKSVFEFSGDPVPAIPDESEQAQIRSEPEEEPVAPTRVEPAEVTKAEIPVDDQMDIQPDDIEEPMDTPDMEVPEMDENELSGLEQELDDALSLDDDDEEIDQGPEIELGEEPVIDLGTDEIEDADLTSRQRRNLNQKNQTIISPGAGIMKARSDENR